MSYVCICIYVYIYINNIYGIIIQLQNRGAGSFLIDLYILILTQCFPSLTTSVCFALYLSNPQPSGLVIGEVSVTYLKGNA